MEPTDITGSAAEFAKFIGSGGLSALIAWFVAKLVLRKVAEESAGGQRAAAEIDIIMQLRQEVDRLHANNVRLSEKIDQLQSEIIALRAENAELRIKGSEANVTLSVIGRRATDRQA